MNHIINLGGQKSLQNNILNLFGRFLVGNIVNDVEIRDSLKGLVSFSIACKTTNKATRILLNGSESEVGLKQILFMEMDVFCPKDTGAISYKKVKIYKHHAVILNSLISVWEDNRFYDFQPKLFYFLKSFVGLLEHTSGKKDAFFLSYVRNQGYFLNAEHIKRTIGKPSKELHDAYLLMAKFLKECQSDESKHVVNRSKQNMPECIKCAEAAMNPYTYFEKMLKRATSFKAIVLSFIILVIYFLYRLLLKY